MLCLLFILPVVAAQITHIPRTEITPVPQRNPHEEEFQKFDSDKNEELTFTEFLLADRPYIEQQSEKFHRFDENGDGVVSREEFDGFYKRVEEEHRKREEDRQSFFNHLGRRDNFEDSPFFKNSFFQRPVHRASSSSDNETESQTALDLAALLFS